MNFEDYEYSLGKLREDNEWVKLSKIIPWDMIEEEYAKKFVNNGHPAHNVRIALGSLIVKQTLNCSDEWTVRHISENPYIQFFIGLKSYQTTCPFGESTLVEFRKRFTEEDLAKINEIIIAENDKTKVETEKPEDKKSDGDDTVVNKNDGTLVMDATCTPADIEYPQDLGLINEAREKTNEIIDSLHEKMGGGKPRTDRNKARKQFLNVSKAKKKKPGKIRKAVRQQLGYLNRNIRSIQAFLDNNAVLPKKYIELWVAIQKIYEQQLEMYKNKVHTVENRIVNLYQPFVRPIVRGKVKAKTEFGAKLHISVINGYTRVERLDFEAYNEADDFVTIVERYRERTGAYPQRILADKIYRNRTNLGFCKEHNIAISGPSLGRPKKDSTIDKKQEYQDICDRNIVESKFGTGKRSYGWGLIKTKLKETSFTVIHMAVIVMNLRKRMQRFLALFFRKIAFFGLNFTKIFSPGY